MESSIYDDDDNDDNDDDDGDKDDDGDPNNDGDKNDDDDDDDNEDDDDDDDDDDDCGIESRYRNDSFQIERWSPVGLRARACSIYWIFVLLFPAPFSDECVRVEDWENPDGRTDGRTEDRR